MIHLKDHEYFQKFSRGLWIVILSINFKKFLYSYLPQNPRAWMKFEQNLVWQYRVNVSNAYIYIIIFKMHIVSLLFNWFKLVNSTLTFFCFCFLFVCFVLGHSLKCPQDVILIANSNLLLSHWSKITFILSALLFCRG